MSKQFRIGILGGMGPAADIRLQQLIREATPARFDQDHIQILCFSNPSIPDRTASLQEDGGEKLATELVESAHILERAGATVIVMACHTAHARFADVQRAVSVPIVSMIDVTCDAVVDFRPRVHVAGLLATEGTVRVGLYRDALAVRGLTCLEPHQREQSRLTRVIAALKSGVSCSAVRDDLTRISTHLVERGANVLLLACTELSLCTAVTFELPNIVIDPLRVVAQRLIFMSNASTPLPSLRDFLQVVISQVSV